MRDFIEDNPLLSAAIGVFLVLSFMALGSYMQEREWAAVEDEMNAPTESDRMAEIRSLQYKDPVAALPLVRDAIANPRDAGEKAQAEELLPSVLGMCVHKSIETKDFDAAEEHLAALGREVPEDHHEFVAARRSWAESLRGRWRELAAANRHAEADTQFAEIVQNDYIDQDTDFLTKYQESKLARWRELLAKGNPKAAQGQLMGAARVLVDAGPRPELANRLYQEKFSGLELYTVAEDLWARDQKELSIPFYQAARLKLNRGEEPFGDAAVADDYQARQEFDRKSQARIVEALVYVADVLLEGEPIVYTTLRPHDIYRAAASNTDEGALRVTPLRRQMALEIEELYTLTGPLEKFKIAGVAREGYLTKEDVDRIYEISHDARADARTILERTSVQVWEAMLDDAEFDPWSRVDAALVAAVDARVAPDADEATRRRELARLVSSREFRAPLMELAAVEELLHEVVARWGLLYIDGNFEEGTRMLRSAMRGAEGDWIREDIAAGLRDLIRNSVSERDFEGLYQLAGFYAAEVGVSDLSDSYRDEFRTTLEKASSYFLAKSEMKYIFMQTLLADSFPDEQVGIDARETAIGLGFKAVADLREEDGTNPDNPSSNLDGLSVITVDNSTDYHLIAFYKGPETFFVRFNPYRKGTVVLKDGEYSVAVIAPRGDIEPYRARIALDSEQSASVYKIEESGGRQENQWAAGNSAWGAYTLLRQPEDAGTLNVDKDTGAASKWRTAQEAR